MANIGKYGEALFRDKISRLDYTVVDVSNNPTYWDKDIDFIITSHRSGLTKSFEVKYDSRINSTGNLYLELTNVHSKGGRGWYEFCKADFLAYGDAQAQVFYIFPLDALRERVSKLNARQARCGGDSTGLLVALTDILDIAQML